MRIDPVEKPVDDPVDPRGLTDGRRQQPYDREGATSFAQESFGGGGEYRGELGFGGFTDQDYGSQGYSGQGYGDRSYGDPDYGGQTFARRTGDESGIETLGGEAGIGDTDVAPGVGDDVDAGADRED